MPASRISSLAALAAAVAVVVGAAPSAAHPPRHAGLPGAQAMFSAPMQKLAAPGPSLGGYSSDGVEFVQNIPLHSDSAGARLLGTYFYITTERDLTIYDVSTPLAPIRVGYMLLPEVGQPVFTEEDPDTNGSILLVSNGGTLMVIDVSDKTAPKLLSSVDGADSHTVSCVLDCTWAYGSDGKITDLRDPKNPRLSASRWTAGKGITSTHDVTEVEPGIVLTSSQPITLLDARTDPENPVVLSQAKKESRFVHANLWPGGGTDDFVLVGGEATGPRCSGSASAAFETWDGKKLRETGEMSRIDEFKLAPGTFVDGRAPDSTYCVHWFTPRQDYANGGVVAISWYEHGTHFLTIDETGQIEEVGFFLGLGGQASAAYWIDETTVYVADYIRGLDILRVDAGLGS